VIDWLMAYGYRHHHRITRAQAVTLGRELCNHGVLAPVDNYSEFVDSEDCILSFGPRLLEKRIKLGRFPSNRIVGPSLHMACPVCYKSFKTPQTRVQHLWNKCAVTNAVL
jgi:hypothetical protein